MKLAFFLLFLPCPLSMSSLFFSLNLIYCFSRSKVAFWSFPQLPTIGRWNCNRNSYLCRLPCAATVSVIQLHLRGGSYTLLQFLETYSYKGINREPGYIPQRNAFGVSMIRAKKQRLIFYFRESFELIKHSKHNSTKVTLSVVINLQIFWSHPNGTSDVWCFQFKHADFHLDHWSSWSRIYSI